MINLRRSGERHRDHHRGLTSWLTFYPRDRADPEADRFGALESLSEHRFPPCARGPGQVHYEAEVITYVREGALAHQDSTGRSGIVQAGEFQRLTCTDAVRCSEMNASRDRWAHVFQIWFRAPRQALEPGKEQKRFSVADRRSSLCVVASPDARTGSLRIHQDALMHSALLEPGRHLIYELTPGRGVWLQIVCGEVTFRDTTLTTGDGVEISEERGISLIAQEATEILLLDLAMPLAEESLTLGPFKKSA